jgi:hypothetical protein
VAPGGRCDRADQEQDADPGQEVWKLVHRGLWSRRISTLT